MGTMIDAGEMIPEVLREHPQCREVFDRHGMKGCGGCLGPYETIRFFAEAHDAPLAELLRDLNAAVAAPKLAPAPLPFQDSGADSIYRPFFTAAILVMLTAGCVWGAANLYRIGRSSDFFAVPTDWTLSHAHAQILGWVGLFVMGFAYHAFPRFRGGRLKRPGLAYGALGLMVVGITLSAVAQTWSHGSGMLTVGMAGGALEVIGVTVFLAQMFQAMHGSRGSSREEMMGAPFIMAGLLAFWLQTILGPVIFHAMATAADERDLVPILAGWMPALRELQVFGFISMMIFGVSFRLLPTIYGLGAPAETEAAREERTKTERRAANGTFRLFALSVAGDMAGWVGLVIGHNPLFLLVLLASYAGLLVSGILLIRRIGIFGPARNPDRSLKFVRASFVWLLIGLVMLNGMFPYNFLTGQPFSHAFLGAVRHAVTVGFISLMILGVSSRVAPTLRGVDPRGLNSLWMAFLLINVGNGIRVATQIATDFTPAVFPLMGVSGFLEVAGLILWAWDLAALMWRMPRASTGPVQDAEDQAIVSREMASTA